jgi:GAF domain-containing protein
VGQRRANGLPRDRNPSEERITTMPTLAETADRALANMQAYSTAHLNMAAAAEMTVDLVASKVFTPAEGMEALAERVARYRDELARIDHEVRA